MNGPAKVLLSLVALSAVSSLASAPGTNAPVQDDSLTLRPPYQEISPTFYEQHAVALWVGGVLLLGLLGTGAWQLSRPRPKPVAPPEVQARRDLEEMKDRLETGAVLSRVSHVVRHYFGRAFDLGTGEMTTAELCAAAGSSPRVGPALTATLRDFLRRCDRLKFAPHGPEPPLGAVREALNLVEQGEARRAELRAAAPKT